MKDDYKDYGNDFFKGKKFITFSTKSLFTYGFMNLNRNQKTSLKNSVTQLMSSGIGNNRSIAQSLYAKNAKNANVKKVTRHNIE